MQTIKTGNAAKYLGDAFDFLRPGAQVFVRSVDADAGTAYVQSPWDSADRITVDLNDLAPWDFAR